MFAHKSLQTKLTKSYTATTLISCIATRMSEPAYAPATEYIRLQLETIGLRDDLDDAHHSLVLMVDGVTVIDEPTYNHRIGKRDYHLQYAWPVIRRRRY